MLNVSTRRARESRLARVSREDGKPMNGEQFRRAGCRLGTDIVARLEQRGYSLEVGSARRQRERACSPIPAKHIRLARRVPEHVCCSVSELCQQVTVEISFCPHYCGGNCRQSGQSAL